MGGGASKNARPSSAHPEGPKSANGKKSTALGDLLFKAGIKKVVMIRHANAKPRDPEAAAVEAGTVLKPETPFANAWTVGDLTRGLTPKGEEQAAAAMTWLNQCDVRAVICSEASRAIDTKEIMTAGKFPAGGQGCLTLHTLHPARSGTPDCEKMFDKLGYGTLNTYYADASVEGLEGKGKASAQALEFSAPTTPSQRSPRNNNSRSIGFSSCHTPPLLHSTTQRSSLTACSRSSATT